MHLREKHEAYDELNFLQRAAVRQSHPVTFIFHNLSLIWGAYFLWQQQLLYVVLSFVLGVGIGQWVAKHDKGFLLKTKNHLNSLQRFVMYHTDIRNLLFQVVAFVLYVVGFWNHSVLFILGSASCVLLGYIFPWLHEGGNSHIQAMSLDE